MLAVHDLLERGIPDVIDTNGLETCLAAEVDHLAGRTDRWIESDRGPLRARARALIGDIPGAQATLAALDPDDVAGAELTAACWAAGRVGPASVASAWLRRLEREAPFLAHDDVPLGPRSLLEGQLLAATGELDLAAERFRSAVVEGDERAPLWGALGRVELARVLRCEIVTHAADGESRLAEVRRLERAAGLFFSAGGYRFQSGQLAAPADPGTPTAPRGGPAVGWLSPGPVWSVGFGVMAPVTVAPARGLAVLRYLVDHQRRPVPATVLDVVGKDGDPNELMARYAAARDGGAGDLGTLLTDEAARSRVQKLVRRTIDRLDAAHPLLGLHLRSTIQTGHLCRYEPSSLTPVHWHTRA